MGSVDEPAAHSSARSLTHVGSLDDDAALRQSVGELFVRCERRVGRYLAQMVGDRALAEDLLQDTFDAVFRSRSQLGAVQSPDAWVFGIARNRALDALRRRRRFESALRRLTDRGSNQSEDDEVVAVRDLLARHLSAEDRALVLLRYLHDFDSNELAAMTGLTPEAVRQRLSRARTRLLNSAQLNDPTEEAPR
jgi:RNA polymerase sigma factor (sigma-70 family)